jgi:hypothetical protein
MTLTLALSYGGREEIAQAAQEPSPTRVAKRAVQPRRRDGRGAPPPHAEPLAWATPTS